jgi:hypothetical protein
MKERTITGKILQKMRDNPLFNSCAVEIKVAKGKTLYKNQIADHQIRALTLTYESAIYFKIPDGGFSQSPFDGFIFKKSDAYVVIYYEIKPKSEVWAIHIKDLPKSNISIDVARSIGLQIFLT